ncbi:MAG TPA: uroporphyrinogen decarboxylase family protein [Chloroflexota bacterium]|nr:uroporphyrinogen decarboxylase family protein [Chloroflexota bacterium]
MGNRHRERVLAALNREAADRPAFDLGGSGSSTLSVGAYQHLRRHLGLAPAPLAVGRRSGQTVWLEEPLLKQLDVDTRPLPLGAPDNTKDVELPDDQFVDEWGIRWARPDESRAGVPHPYYAAHGPFWNLPTEDLATHVGKHRWPDPLDPGRTRGLGEAARALRESTGCAVVLNLPVGFIHLSQFLRGYETWLTDLVEDPAAAEALMDRVLDVWLPLAAAAVGAASPWADAVWYGDDIAFQDGPMVSPALYRRLLKPRQRRVMECIHGAGRTTEGRPVPVLYHTCGSVADLLPDLVDIGVDALNPVQVSARGMDPVWLKREFGRDLCFWGGVDTQRVLPYGSPADVRAEVERRRAELGPDGYVVAAVHNIQPEVPPENILALALALAREG